MTLIGVKSVELFYAEDIFDTVSPSENVYLWNDVERVLNSRIGLRKLRTGKKSGKYNRLIDHQDTSVPHGERVRTTFKIGDIHENTIWQVYTEDFDDNSTALTFQKLVVGKATRNCNLLTSTNITDTDALNQINVSLRLTTDEGCNTNLHNLTTHITTTHNIQIVAMHNQSPWRQQKVLPMNYVNKKKTFLTLASDTFYMDSNVELIVTLQLLQSVKKQANILINVLYKSKIANQHKTSNHLLTVETSKQPIYNTEKFAPSPKVPASDLSIVENNYQLTFCSYDRRRIKFTCVKVKFDESIEVHVLSQHNRLHKIYAGNGTRALFQDSADRIQTRNMLLLTVDKIPTTLMPAKQINISDGGKIGQQFHVKQGGLWNQEDKEIIKFP